MTTCSCVVIQHPSGEVWLPQSVTPCPQHRYGQRYEETK